MNETKEILDLMKFANDDIMWCDTLTLNVKQCHLLLDYITNLQESQCEYKEKCNEYNVGCIKEILCNYLKTNKDLQQRIDKAIEILKDTSVDMPETLLIETIDYERHILNGGE